MRKLTSPSPKQIECYRLVHIHGAKTEQAAAMLGCTKTNVLIHLRKLRELRPDLFEQNERQVHKVVRFGNQEQRENLIQAVI